ncbi:SDR family oxidoreductase [Solirubrobacter phytolaccae]|uniref:SDR family oxidoreductase n=1 Tax=Solirubrobacter phytolaccae TaxID=1404360 RepID=A0A9X3NAA6_9ACTN|nr:SDR family oxidoreductase [Solirubrobacter phytolaccae]MDA0178992.1 SDR family oxidoreductase [Solirubrobacter phytolaccae]
MSRYAGRSAVILGGTHGMGEATAALLRAEGAEVLVTGRRGGDVHVDLTRLADLGALAEAVRERFGQVDLLHVNAGFAKLEPFDAVTEASYDRTFDVNTKGAFFAVQALAPLVRDGGAIVFTSSVADQGGSPAMIVYGAAKAAARSLVAGFAAALLPRGIRVNAVSPGFIDTPSYGIEGISDDDRAAFHAVGDAITPMGRHGTAEEVARAVVFLAFEATFTTGARLAVDGGLGEGIEAPTAA